MRINESTELESQLNVALESIEYLKCLIVLADGEREKAKKESQEAKLKFHLIMKEKEKVIEEITNAKETLEEKLEEKEILLSKHVESFELLQGENSELRTRNTKLLNNTSILSIAKLPGY